MLYFCSHIDTIGHSITKCRKDKENANEKRDALVKQVRKPVSKEKPFVSSFEVRCCYYVEYLYSRVAHVCSGF